MFAGNPFGWAFFGQDYAGVSASSGLTVDLTGVFAAASASAPVPAVAITVAPASSSAPASSPVPAVKIAVAPSASAAPASSPAPAVGIAVAPAAASSPASAAVPNFGEGIVPSTASAPASATVPAVTIAVAPAAASATAAVTAPAVGIQTNIPAAAASASAPVPAASITGDITVAAPVALATASMAVPDVSTGTVTPVGSIDHHFGGGRPNHFQPPEREQIAESVSQDAHVHAPTAKAVAWMPLVLPAIEYEYVPDEPAPAPEPARNATVKPLTAAARVAAAFPLLKVVSAQPEITQPREPEPERAPAPQPKTEPVPEPEPELDEILAVAGVTAARIYRADLDDDLVAVRMLLTL